MDLIKYENGFTLKSNSVSFDFESSSIPCGNNGLFELNIIGEVPVPVTKSGDQLFLPIDEGIVITAEDEYIEG